MTALDAANRHPPRYMLARDVRMPDSVPKLPDNPNRQRPMLGCSGERVGLPIRLGAFDIRKW
jgi:hypothetical protein